MNNVLSNIELQREKVMNAPRLELHINAFVLGSLFLFKKGLTSAFYSHSIMEKTQMLQN